MAALLRICYEMASTIEVGGRWRAQVRRRGHKAQTRTFGTKAVAERWARKIERQIDTTKFHDYGEAKRTTIKDLIDRFKLERPNKIGRSHGYALDQLGRLDSHIWNQCCASLARSESYPSLSAFLVELDAEISVASTTVPARSIKPLLRSSSLIAASIGPAR